MTFKAQLVSVSKKGNQAQVIVVIGEGSNRRSVTRHIECLGESLGTGYYPDDSILKTNRRLYADASIALETAEAGLKVAQLALAKAKKEQLVVLKSTVEIAKMALEAAQQEMRRVQREHPIKVEFKF